MSCSQQPILRASCCGYAFFCRYCTWRCSGSPFRFVARICQEYVAVFFLCVFFLWRRVPVIVVFCWHPVWGRIVDPCVRRSCVDRLSLFPKMWICWDNAGSLCSRCFFVFFAVTIFSFFPHCSRCCHGSARVLLHGIASATFDARWVRLQMTGQTGSQRFMAPEVFDGMPYNEKVRNACATCHCFRLR